MYGDTQDTRRQLQRRKPGSRQTYLFMDGRASPDIQQRIWPDRGPCIDHRMYVCMYVCMLDKYDRSVSAHFLPA
jgi:hypothetical protein